MDSEQLYYKVENKDCDLFKRANEFLAMEKNCERHKEKPLNRNFQSSQSTNM